jgi:hypothetical protein
MVDREVAQVGRGELVGVEDRVGDFLSCPRRPTSAPATGRSRRCPPTCSIAASRSPARSTQDDHQRAQLGRQGLHGRLRGRQQRHLGQPRSRARQPRDAVAGPSPSPTPRPARSTRSRERSPSSSCARAAGTSKSAHVARSTASRCPARSSTSASTSSTTRRSWRAARGPYFYLPKMESHLEARLWNDVFVRAQERTRRPAGTIKATCLIETLPPRSRWTRSSTSCATTRPASTAGAGTTSSASSRSARRPRRPCCPTARRSRWTGHFLRAYSLLLIKTCHRRNVHAMGGMAAQIPIKDDPAANEAAIAKVRADKLREVTDGHDGTWVAHPGLVPIAKEIFDAHMPGRTSSASSARTSRHARRPARRAEGGRAPRPGCATTSASACSTSRPGCAATAACRSTT